MNFYYGVVENRQDPLRLGRCQVRVVGLHTHDKSQLPTEDLPWSVPMQPVVSAAMNGIGLAPVGPVEGTSVIIIFADDDFQQPIMIGTVGGIPSTPGSVDVDDDAGILPKVKTKDIKLRTVVGPTNGNVLTFYDPDEEVTNFTSSLKPNMYVYGFGIPEGTTIVSINSRNQITVSKSVTNFGENIITFGDPPSNLNAVTQGNLQGILVDGSGNPVLSGSGDPIRTGSAETSPIKPTPVNSTIPTIPPPKSSSNTSKSTAGIKALIAACDKVGLTTKEQKCSLLGIAGGESTWIPQLEAYNYSAQRLKQVYSFATEEDIKKYSNAQKNGMSRQEFFSWAYGPTKRGKNFLGNQTDEDGGKYFGRGFIQLTGKANYQRYQNLANAMGLSIDIVNNPDSLDSDINVSALVAALYIKDRVKGVGANEHPGYFFAAKKAVGVNTPDIAARKLSYYEYFYGYQASGGVEKDAGAPSAEPPRDPKASPAPGPSEKSKRTGSAILGFRDPNSKYPLEEYLNEPDTNRLARGIIDGTVVPKKDANRKLAVPRALRYGSWDQPQATYGAKYPFNHIFESESGHIQEFDDTPGQERIHTYHRTGTFTEIDPVGTQVNYIVGDNFVIMERNGCISVSGECNITVEGNTNIFARTDANIQVSNNASIEVGNNVELRVFNDIDVVAGRDINYKAVGNFNLEAQNINIKSRENMDVLVAQATKITSTGSMDLLTSGTMQVDYGTGYFGSGANSAKVEDLELKAPDKGVPVNPIVPFLIPPERQTEEKAVAETPEEADTPEGRLHRSEQSRKEGIVAPPPPVPDESAKSTGGKDTKVPVSCQEIYATKSYTNDFRMSKNFTLGMLIDGGVGGKHRLVDQMLSESRNSSPRLYTAQEIVCNLAQTAQNILEPMLDVLPGNIGGYGKQWRINSGYRLKGIVPNESATSKHCMGLAFDIGILLPNKNQASYDIIRKADGLLPYDQLILEYSFPSSIWLHVSYDIKTRRKQAFTMVNHAYYKAGFVLLNEIPPPRK